MKKSSLFMVALSLLLILSACGTSSSDSTPSDETAQENTNTAANSTIENNTDNIFDDGPKELPRPLTSENAEEFLEIIKSEGTVKHDNELRTDWVYHDGVLAIYCSGTLWYPRGEAPWKEHNDEITEIIIADGCTGINNDYVSFYPISNLTSMILPEGLENLPDLGYSDNLTYINIPTSIKKIDESQFKATNIEHLVLPDGIKSIGREAFAYCENLKSINIPSSVTKIGQEAFTMCKNLSSELELPDGLVELGNEAFLGCSNLTGDLKIPDNLKEIGRNAFSGCSKVTGNIVIPPGTTVIRGGLFEGCEKITSITLPEGLESIGDNAFYGCKGLTEIKIPNTVTQIGNKAFGECLGLTSFHIPESIRSFYYNPLYKCDNLTSITSDSKWCVMDGDVLIFREPGATIDLVELPDGTMGPVYRSYVVKALNSITGDYTVTRECYGIGNGAFANCTGLESVTMQWTTVDEEAFEGCTGLKYVSIGGGNIIDQIGPRAFYGCTNLKTVDITGRIYLVSTSAFEDCIALETVNEVNTKADIECLGSRAFANCQSLTSYPFVKVFVEEDAFEGCINLNK